MAHSYNLKRVGRSDRSVATHALENTDSHLLTTGVTSCRWAANPLRLPFGHAPEPGRPSIASFNSILRRAPKSKKTLRRRAFDRHTPKVQPSLRRPHGGTRARRLQRIEWLHDERPGLRCPDRRSPGAPNLGLGRTSHGKCGSDALLVEFAGAEGRDPAPIQGSGENSATHRSWALAALGVSSAWPRTRRRNPAPQGGGRAFRHTLHRPSHPPDRILIPEENSLESLLK